MKILVPTDFSEISVNAAHYAAALAHSVHGEIILLFGAYVQGPPHASMLKEQRLEAEIVRAAEEDCSTLEHQLTARNKKLKISHVVVQDYPLKSVIESFAARHAVDIIVMGTRGAGGLGKILFGSNTAAVIANSSVPVLAVPASATFGGIRNLVYASDGRFVRAEVQQLMPLVRSLQAHLHILHVVPPGAVKKQNAERVAGELAARFHYENISFHLYNDGNVEEGITEFTAGVAADMLVLFTHQPAFFERVLGSSHAREMSFHLWLPLLTLKRRKTTTGSAIAGKRKTAALPKQ